MKKDFRTYQTEADAHADMKSLRKRKYTAFYSEYWKCWICWFNA